MSSISGILGGVLLVITGGGDGNVNAGDVLHTGKVIYQIEEKNKDGTWKASAHEESHQLIKDILKQIGRN